MTRLIALVTLLVPLMFTASAGSSGLKLERAANNHDYYSGSINVSGKFEMLLDETSVQIMGKRLCFIPEGESQKVIPRDDDQRAPWFCFSNRDQANKLLSIPKEEAGSCGFTGTAEIVISDYVVDKTEGDAFDEAKLVTVIKHSRVSPLSCK